MLIEFSEERGCLFIFCFRFRFFAGTSRVRFISIRFLFRMNKFPSFRVFLIKTTFTWNIGWNLVDLHIIFLNITNNIRLGGRRGSIGKSWNRVNPLTPKLDSISSFNAWRHWRQYCKQRLFGSEINTKIHRYLSYLNIYLK